MSNQLHSPKNCYRTEIAVSMGPLVTEKNEKIAEYKSRKLRFEQMHLPQEEATPLIIDKGWSEKRRLADRRIIVEKSKSFDILIKDRLWCTLYKFGFEELSKGHDFWVQVNDHRSRYRKPIGLLAKVDDIIVIAEFKTSVKKVEESISTDIQNFSSNKKAIANTLRKVYGADKKLKIVWLFVTGNIILSTRDRTKASSQNIQIIEERELRYFEEIAKNIGPAAKYQFLGEFIGEQEIPTLKGYNLPAIRTKLGGNTVYYFVAPYDRLLPIAFVNHRGLRDPDGFPAYQRILSKSRLREIGAYLDSGGFFPNSIVINFRNAVRFDPQTSSDKQITFGYLYLPSRLKSAWIVDGQHRLFGYTETKEIDFHHTVPCIAFDRMTTTAEAELFATINSKQQKVARGLLDELSGEMKLDSPDFHERCGAIACRALDILATETGNPFEDKLKTADLAESDTVCLTVSQIKSEIVSTKLLGAKDRNGSEQPGPFSRRTTHKTLEALCEGLTEFFALIQAADPERWAAGRQGYLCSNIPVQGYIRLLGALVSHLESATNQQSNKLNPDELIRQLKPYLQPVLDFIETSDDGEFAKRFKPIFGSGGPKRYFLELCRLINAKFSSFKPLGFDDYLNSQATETTEKANILINDIVQRVHNHIIQSLKNAYGANFFDVGIPQKEIKLKAQERKYDDKEKQMPPETYLDVIDLKKIVEHANNWELFKETMNIKLDSERKGLAKYLKWFDFLNEIRRVSAHPFGRSYKDADLDFLEFINEQLDARHV